MEDSRKHIPKDDLVNTNLTVNFIQYHTLDEGAIKSGDQFYSIYIPNIIRPLYITTSDGIVKVENAVIELPHCKYVDGDDRLLFPYEAICRQITYQGRLMVSINQYKKDKNGELPINPTSEIRKCIGMVPIMVKSSRCNLYGMTYQELVQKKECPFMLGGYFIYKGGLKSIISQEELATNQLFRFHVKKTNDIKCEMRFVRKDYSHTHVTVRYDPKTKLFYVVLPFLKGSKHPEMDEEGISVKSQDKSPITLGVFMNYFGVDLDKMVKMVKMWHTGNNSKCTMRFIDKILERTMEEAELCADPEYEFIRRLNTPNYTKEEKQAKIRANIDREFFNGLEYMEQNINMITLMTCRLIQLVAGDPVDDRDSYINKRSDMGGIIMANLFRTLVMKLFRDVQETVDKSHSMNPYEVVVKNFSDKPITNGFGLALANGNFSKNSFNSGGKDGVSQVLLYNSLPCMISQIRRRAKPLDNNGKMIGPRQLHNMQWGIICPSETPEGSPCGLTNNASIVEVVSIQRDLNALISLLQTHIEKEKSDKTSYPLIINGMWEGWVDYSVLGILKKWRLEGKLPFDVSIGMSPYDEIKINGDAGRSTRPCLIIGEGGKTVLEECLGTLNLDSVGCTWADVIKLQAVEYIDKFEEETLNIADSPWNVHSQHTHCEIDPSAIFGYCANLIPFPTHNPGPRIAYECSMLKQAVGTARLNEKYTLDTNAKVLDYPQKYITETDMARASGVTELGMGQVPIVAVLAAAYNQEDSIIVNKAAVDRGLFRTTVYKTYKELQKTSERELFCNPVPILYAGDNIKKKRKNYDLIDKHTGIRDRTTKTYHDELPGCVGSDWNETNTAFLNPVHPNHIVRKISLESGMRYCEEYIEKIPYEEECYEGAPRVGARVQPGDVLIGKIKYIDDKPVDCSIIHKGTDTGVVDTVMMTQDPDGNIIMDVKVRYYRIPKMGDKFAQRHAQKGVIGLLCPAADMPFVATGPSAGMIPDVLINPHAFPSRMTIGYILELLMNKEGCVKGHYHQATAFRITEDSDTHNAKTLIKTIGESLKSSGYTPEGKEVMYDGKTGAPLKCRIYMGPVGYQVLKHQVDDKMHCVDAETDILTYDGWKNVAEITKDDPIATLNDAGELVYQKPINIFHYEKYEGSMYYVSNANIDLAVTGHHRMWVSKPYGRQKIWKDYEFVKAEDLIGKHVKYKKDAIWTAPDYQFILPAIIDGNNMTRDAKIVDMDAWLTFFGIWIAEGWTNNEKNQHACKRVSICQCKERVRNVIFTALQNLGYNYCTSKDKIIITNIQLYSYMKQFSVGAPNKVLPEWVWKLSKKQCQLLAESMMLGDGSTSKSGQKMYYSSSIKLADDFMRLCLHAGWAANIKLHYDIGNITTIYGRVVKNKYKLWRVGIIKYKNNPAVNHGHNHSQQVQKEKLVTEKCPVYCVEVPNERFYMRRNGKPVWTGNSRSRGPVQRLTRQPVEGRSRNGGLRFGEMESQCFTSYGSTAFLQERLLKVSDEYDVVVCTECGYIAVNHKKLGPRCLVCSKKDIKSEFAKITIPFPAKLLAQDLMACNIAFKFKVNKNALTGEYEATQVLPVGDNK